jgi:hypothetical protein
MGRKTGKIIKHTALIISFMLPDTMSPLTEYLQDNDDSTSLSADASIAFGASATTCGSYSETAEEPLQASVAQFEHLSSPLRSQREQDSNVQTPQQQHPKPL